MDSERSHPSTWEPGALIVNSAGAWAIVVARKTPGDDTPEWLPGWWLTTEHGDGQIGRAGIADEIAASRGWHTYAEHLAEYQHLRNLYGNAQGAVVDTGNLPGDTKPADAIYQLIEERDRLRSRIIELEESAARYPIR